jgi:hypothetical protein
MVCGNLVISVLYNSVPTHFASSYSLTSLFIKRIFMALYASVQLVSNLFYVYVFQ